MQDVREKMIPVGGMIGLCDAETGQLRTIDCRNGRLLKRLKEQSQSREKELKNLCHEVNADLLIIGTEDDYLYEIVRFFRDRNNRSANA
jgi:hypothetical protein